MTIDISENENLSLQIERVYKQTIGLIKKTEHVNRMEYKDWKRMNMTMVVTDFDNSKCDFEFDVNNKITKEQII